VLTAPKDALAAYARGEVDLEHVESALYTAASVLESPDRELATAMREAEGALEIIRFTISADEERAAASRVLDPLRAQIDAALQ
jgi:hypothetical protein